MFLSGSFAVNLQCSHQCDHSVPGLEILKEPKGCTKDVPNQYICSVLGVFLQCNAFGKIWGNFGNTASTFQMFQVSQFSWHVLAVSPEFPQSLPKSDTLQENSQDTTNGLIWNIFGTSLWFFSNVPSLVHCDHTDGNTAKSLQMSHSGTSLVLSLANLKAYPQFT